MPPSKGAADGDEGPFRLVMAGADDGTRLATAAEANARAICLDILNSEMAVRQLFRVLLPGRDTL